jgi:hypothetical protein
MSHLRTWKRLTAFLAGTALALQLSGCGTVLHPERRGQPTTGRLDVAITVLDAAGLLLFFVPGVIAFAVDFATGAIYLPPEGVADTTTAADGPVRVLRMSGAELTPERIEAVIREQTGQSVHLTPGAYRAARLDRIEDFSSATMERLGAAARPTEVRFGQSSE